MILEATVEVDTDVLAGSHKNSGWIKTIRDTFHNIPQCADDRKSKFVLFDKTKDANNESSLFFHLVHEKIDEYHKNDCKTNN